MYDLIDPQSANGPVQGLLDATQQQLGRVPNLYRAMANSPKALAGYLAFRGALQEGGLDREMRERIALLTAEVNACDYCVAAHSFRAEKIACRHETLQIRGAPCPSLPK
jgi:AhpD family alkylhydroperoxidase